MDFRQTTQPANNRPAAAPATPVSTSNPKPAAPKQGGGNKWFNILNVVILVGVAIIVALVALALGRGTNNSEYKFVDHQKYQAVFLNNGQVYFGNIESLNSKYVQLDNIFYLTQSTTGTGSSASSNYSLVKLGCQQIHDPYDQMVINRDQITFWENLQDSGKVVTSIKQFQKQNPKGPDCSQVSTQTQASNTTGAQGSSTTTTTPSTTTPTTNSSSTGTTSGK